MLVIVLIDITEFALVTQIGGNWAKVNSKTSLVTHVAAFVMIEVIIKCVCERDVRLAVSSHKTVEQTNKWIRVGNAGSSPIHVADIFEAQLFSEC